MNSIILQDNIESDETDYEDETDFQSSNVMSTQSIDIKVDDVKNNDNFLTNREYLKLVFYNEDLARILLAKRASQFWWLKKFKSIFNVEQDFSHIGLKR